MNLLEQMIHEALSKSECVALFVIVMALLFILHGLNSRRMDKILADLEQRKHNDNKE